MADSLDKLMYSFVVEDVLKGFFVGIPLALISSMVSWFLWLPFGIMNTGFAHWYRAALNTDIKQ